MYQAWTISLLRQGLLFRQGTAVPIGQGGAGAHLPEPIGSGVLLHEAVLYGAGGRSLRVPWV